MLISEMLVVGDSWRECLWWVAGGGVTGGRSLIAVVLVVGYWW